MRTKAHVFLLSVVALACAGALAGVALFPPAAPEPAPDGSAPTDLLDGRITALEENGDAAADDPMLPPGATSVRVTAELSDGREVTFDMVDETGDTFAVGQRVRIVEAEGPDGGVTHYINDVDRERPLLVLAAVFLFAVLAFGRWKGLRSLVGLGLSLLAITGYVVPAILAGRDPVVVALSASVIIMALTLYMTHGIGPKTTAAAVGTLAALGVTAALSWFFIQFASLTGLASEEARMANVQVGGLSLRGLLLAGIIIGALGVLDDITMAQSSTVFEFRAADPRAGAGELFTRAMKVGRDHVAATINTLFLAYAGASLPLLILFSGSPYPLGVIASSEVVAVEVVRTLVGSIGLMASVPLTTMLAAWLAGRPEAQSLGPGHRAGHGAAQQPVPPGGPAAQPAPARTDGFTPVGHGVAPPVGHDNGGPVGRGRPGPVVRDEFENPFADVKPFSAADEAETEWEQRLRDSYGLDRLHAARQQAARERAAREQAAREQAGYPTDTTHHYDDR